jgi:hypothetical protein
MDTTTLTIIIVTLFLVAVTVGSVYISRHSEKKKEPRETRSCVLCNQPGTTWSKKDLWGCCDRIAVVCSICEREAGDKLEARLNAWHEQLFCPESIAAHPVFERVEAAEKASAEEMMKRPDALHAANLAAAQLHRAEKEVQAELQTKLDWANKMLDNLANEEERKALWVALGARYSKLDFTKAMEQVVKRGAA